VHTVYDLCEAIATNAIPTPNFEDGVANQRVLHAMERSAKTGSWAAV